MLIVRMARWCSKYRCPALRGVGRYSAAMGTVGRFASFAVPTNELPRRHPKFFRHTEFFGTLAFVAQFDRYSRDWGGITIIGVPKTFVNLGTSTNSIFWSRVQCDKKCPLNVCQIPILSYHRTLIFSRVHGQTTLQTTYAPRPRWSIPGKWHTPLVAK